MNAYSSADRRPAPLWTGVFELPVVLTLLLLSLALLPMVRGNPRLVWAFIGVGGTLLLWELILLLRAARTGRRFEFEFVPVKSHYVQACVQFCVYAYWGWHWRRVYQEAHLIFAQVLFLYVCDALLSWSRGRRWRLGFGPFPIIFSTNLFMWFKDDWFIFQFLMVATGAFGKEFITWRRDGKETHIFNPSAFGLALFSLALLVTGDTDRTWGQEVATMLGLPQYIYLEIFLLGLVVQYFFRITLMTLAATAALCLSNLIYTRTTGVYYFVDSNIPIAVFLGLHLLITDPSTSPRTNLGKFIFGGLYGLGVFFAYGFLSRLGAPRFYDKLLIVPLLNLSVKAIDWVARLGVLERFHRWETAIAPAKLNLAHMTGWVAIFGAMLATGFVEARHPGESIGFWKKACEEGRPHAFQNFTTMLLAASAKGSAEAANELGLIYVEGKLTQPNPEAAARYFARACELGSAGGCANAAIQYLFSGVKSADSDVARALAHLEQEAGKRADGRSCYLVGFAYETGQGRPVDRKRARELYDAGAALGDVGAAKNVARMRLSGEGGPVDYAGAAQALEKACAAQDAQSCTYLASMYHQGAGVPRDEERALALLNKACGLGSAQACETLKRLRQQPASAPPP